MGSSGNPVGFATTDLSGNYTVSGLSTGSYRVEFSAGFGGNYIAQFYNGKSTLATADPVSVTAGTTAPNINAALQQGGQITGTVIDASTHSGIANIQVNALGSSGNPVGFATTDLSGNYTVSGLSTGSYRVEFSAGFGGNYIAQFYNGKSTLATADPVSVTAGTTTPDINAALQQGGQITGTVIDASTHSGIANIQVNALGSSGNPVGFATTDLSGNYTVSGLSTGSYRVEFSAGFGGNYIAQFYNGKSTLATADAVSVTAGSTTSGIDAALQTGGQISGVVTDASTHSGIANIQVAVLGSSGNFVGSGLTASDGTYTVSGLSTGSYRVEFSAGFGSNYITQYYNGKSTLATADAVSVTAGSTTSGINAALQTGGQITGTVTDASTHSALSNVCHRYGSTDNEVGFANTDASGHYTVSGRDRKLHGGFAGSGSQSHPVLQRQVLAGDGRCGVGDGGLDRTGHDAALQTGGQIYGPVTDASTHSGIANIQVNALGSSGNSGRVGLTASDGTYTVSGLSTGSYRVEFSAGFGGNYITQYYNGKSTLATADPVSVTAGTTAPNINAALQQGGQITGTVIDASTHSGIANIQVNALGSSGNPVGFATTDSSGNYTVSGLSTGSYRVEFSAGFGGNYIAQFYNGKSTLATADAVSVTAGSTTSGIDAALQTGGQISGVVTDASTHSGIANIQVAVLGSSGNFVGSGLTASDGTYTVSGLPTGTYHVAFSIRRATTSPSTTTASLPWRRPMRCR